MGARVFCFTDTQRGMPIATRHPLRIGIGACGRRLIVAADVCAAVGIANARAACARLTDAERGLLRVGISDGKPRRAVAVTEAGLFLIVLRAHGAMEPGTRAYAFRQWVSAELMPALRKPIRLEREVVPHQGLPPGRVRVLTGDCLTVLRGMPDAWVNACVTSSPYFRVRDYGHPGQLGMERSRSAYVTRLVRVLDEVRRVLRGTGTLWLVIGDNYCTRRAIRPDGKRTVVRGGRLPSWAEARDAGRTMLSTEFAAEGIREKSLFLVPHLLALELQRRGWYVRADIAWVKPNVPPGRVVDRPVQCTERVLMLTKSPNYVFHADALRERGADGTGRDGRDVWEIAPSQGGGEHTASMPQELVARCVLASTNVGDHLLDPFAGTGTTGVVAKLYGRDATLIEINPGYARVAQQRVDKAASVRRSALRPSEARKLGG